LRRLIALPHKACDSECYVNGIEDILAGEGRTYADHLLSVVGGMASFSYLKFKRATPPNMVFWGANTKYFVPNLERVVGFRQTVVEGRGSSTTFSRIRESIDQDRPVMAGALDMYYLPYYPTMCHSQHIPIHYVLVVGYDDERGVFCVHDCGRSGVEEVPFEDLEKAMDVKVPGMSRKNTFRVFKMPTDIPSELDVAAKGFRLKAGQMLRPPVSMFGIPAMRKLSEEVLDWEDGASFDHLATFATSPPTLPKTFENSHGMRLWQAAVLDALSAKYGVDAWKETSELFGQSGKMISELCEAAVNRRWEVVAELMGRVADTEERAYSLLERASPSNPA
jgi:hypothetical protein